MVFDTNYLFFFKVLVIYVLAKICFTDNFSITCIYDEKFLKFVETKRRIILSMKILKTRN